MAARSRIAPAALDGGQLGLAVAAPAAFAPSPRRPATAGSRVRLRRRRAVTTLCLLVLLAGCGARRRPVQVPDPEPGSIPFQSYCAACHQYDGQQVGDAPPLDGSPWVTGPEDRLIRIVLHGVRGPMQVHGRTYDREMPGFGQVLSDAEVASLLSFIRKRFGAGSEPIRAETVSRVRAANPTRTDYWNVEELLHKP